MLVDGGLGAVGSHRATVVILVIVAILVGREASKCSGEMFRSWGRRKGQQWKRFRSLGPRVYRVGGS